MIGPLGRLVAAATLRQRCPQMTQRPGNGLNGGRGAEESYLKEDTIERSSRTREGVRMDWYDPNYANGHFDIHAREASQAQPSSKLQNFTLQVRKNQFFRIASKWCLGMP